MKSKDSGEKNHKSTRPIKSNIVCVATYFCTKMIIYFQSDIAY